MKMRLTKHCIIVIFLMASFLFPTLGTTQVICPGITNTGPITPCLLQNGCDPNVTSVGDPYIDQEDCATGLTRYLARSADVGQLADMLLDNIPKDPITHQSITECIPPYNKVKYTDYCPDRYCDMIKKMVEMDIQFLQRAYWGAYGHEHQFNPGDEYFEIGKQMIRDINYAYDCAGKRRPIIQGTAMDNIAPVNFESAKEWDDDGPHGGTINRNISTCMIQKYFEEFPEELDDIDPDSDPAHPMTYEQYYFREGIVRSDLFFEKNRIGIDGPGDNNTTVFYPKIEKLEFRMFVLYQAWAQIEMGYTAIHMGIYFAYAASEAPSYDKLYGVAQAIRKYAADRGTFVLLSGEPPSGLSATHGGTNEFIFDFDSRAMRPREIKPGENITGDGNNCNEPIAQAIIDEFNTSPCADYPYKAVVDPCTIGGSNEGISPQGCHVAEQPYTVHFDGFHVPDHPWEASNGPNGLTWGFHDHQWFAQLPKDCQRWWFDHFYCDRRNYHDGKGFIVIPGIILYDADFTNDDDGAEQLISDDTAFVEMLSHSTLLPITPTVSIEEEPAYPYGCKPVCNGVMAPAGKTWLIAKKCYKIKIGDKDCSSTYSIHITDPNGDKLPVVWDDSYSFCPELPGVYEINIRQDNLGLPASTNGTQIITANQYLDTHTCWKLIDADKCGAWRTTPACDGFDGHKRTYEFSIEAEYSGDIIRSVRPVENHFVIRNTQQPTLQKVTGLIDVWDADVTQMELLVDVERSGVTSTSYSNALLPNCGQGGSLSRKPQTALQSGEKSIQIYPNPTETDLNIQYFSDAEEDIKVVVYNALGQIQYSNQQSVATGPNSWQINTANYPTGNYMLLMIGEQLYEYKKFVKKSN